MSWCSLFIMMFCSIIVFMILTITIFPIIGGIIQIVDGENARGIANIILGTIMTLLIVSGVMCGMQHKDNIIKSLKSKSECVECNQNEETPNDNNK